MTHLLGLGSIILFACSSLFAADDKPPDPPREFRGVWVASVSNIDWPSKKGLSSADQQAELRAIFAKAADLRLNAVIFQIRPMCDALYQSQIEPWSEYLTGTLGQAPSPAYDPLELAVREAHARGLELHAWFNPYRARHSSATSPIPGSHIIKRRPDLAKRYGTHYWLNPTSKEVQDYTMNVILDVVRRYDIDGVHIDDYFYPYPERGSDGKVIPFPDDDTWAAYQKDGGKLARDDWRRDAVNKLIERLYREVKQAKPWVKVGISPFGIWRPNVPAGIAGFDPYTQLYADSRLWFKEGWCDYLAPQLYWPIKQEKQSFPLLFEWWNEQNAKDRQLWPGLYTSRVTGKDGGWEPREIIEQIKITRGDNIVDGRPPAATGHIHFSMKALMNDTGRIRIVAALKFLYSEPALVPAMPSAGSRPPAKPSLHWQQEGRELAIRAADERTRLFVVRSRTGNRWTIRIEPIRKGEETRIDLAAQIDEAVVTAVDRTSIESPAAKLERGK